MKFALAQINTGTDIAANLDKVRDYARRASGQGLDFIVFPEATMCAFGSGLRSLVSSGADAWRRDLAALAAETQLTIIVGEFAATEDRIVNLLAAYSPLGQRDDYAKIHLYDAFGFKESDTVDPGQTPTVIDIGGTGVGLTICYDIRFPKLYAEVSRAGAQLAIVSASWGAGPGKVDQWQTLARARALDSNMVVVALGQADPEVSGVAVPPTGPTGVGHSLVADPFGRVLVSLDGAERLEIVDVDLQVTDEAATAIPVLANARLGY